MRRTATIGIIVANCVAFAITAFIQQDIFMNSRQGMIALLSAGANLNAFTLNGEPWRLVTSMFLHSGIIHLGVNMYALYYSGIVAESLGGASRYLLVYFICGIAASIASLYFNVFIVSVGASGAIFGLFGYVTVAEITGQLGYRREMGQLITNFIIFIVINTGVAMVMNVDIAGHIGGVVFGVIIGLMHFKFRILYQHAFLVLILITTTSVIFFLPKDQVEYYSLFQRILKAERRTNQWFAEVKTENTLKDSLALLKPEWDSIYNDIGSIPRISSSLAEDTSALRMYVRLRRQETDYRVKMVERESYIYLDSLEINHEKFDSVPKLHHYPDYSLGIGSDEPLSKNDEAYVHQYDTVKIYYDASWREVDVNEPWLYYRTGARDSVQRWQGRVRDYYRDGKIQMKGYYKDGFKDGVFIFYSDRSTYQSAGRYEKESATGKWEYFHWNGKMQREVFHGRGGFTRDTWDSLGNRQVVNGFGRSTTWFANGKIAEEGSYENGYKEGVWHGYHEDGSPYYQELFRSNKLVRGASLSRDGRKFVYDGLSEFPAPENGMPDLLKYVAANIPSDFKDKGTVKLLFTVDVDGSVRDFLVLESSCVSCNAEAIRLVQQGPRWRPSLIHGETKVQGEGYVVITF